MGSKRKYYEVAHFIDDGDKVEFIIHWWSQNLTSYLEEALKQLDFPYKLSSEQGCPVFIFTRKDYFKVVSNHTEVANFVKLVKAEPSFTWLELRGQTRKDVKSNVSIKPLLYVCPSCGWATDDLANVCELHDKGGITHWCPECKSSTDIGGYDTTELEKNYNIIFLTSYWIADPVNCATCRGER